MNSAAGLALTVALLLLNGFFVAAEFALVAARRSAIEPLAEAGSRRAASTLRAMEQVSLMMAGAQLGITVCSLALGAVSEPALAHLIKPVFDAVGLPDAALHPLAFAFALAVVTVLHVTLGEMVPKNITLAGADRAALWLGPPLALIVRALKPLVWTLNHSANLIVRMIGLQPRDEVRSTANREELAGLIEESHAHGLLDPGERSLLAGAIAFDSAVAADVALPLARVHTVPPGASAADVEQLAARTGVTRFPVRDDGHLLGYLHLKDTLGVPADQRTAPLTAAVLRSLPDIPTDTPLAEAIDLMRASGAHMGRVTTTSGTAGVITLDDILASLVRG